MLPLEDIKILDLSRGYAPAFGTWILGDLGAEVINVDPLMSGVRTIVRPSMTERRSAAYNCINRNKKSIMINLKSEEGLRIFHKLAETADVILESFRPGVAKRLGIDYPTMRETNPRIVYCSVTGYGQDGPYRDIPGHDPNYLGIAGILDLIGEAGRRPVPPLNLVGDEAGGALFATIGILTALMAREKTGKGQYIDTSYTDGAISLMMSFASSYFETGTLLKRGESIFGFSYPYCNLYETKDGKFIILACAEPWLWESFCREIGREDFIPFHTQYDHRFRGPEGEKWQEISSHLEQLFLTKTRDEWFELLNSKNIAISKLLSLDEVATDPHVLHRKMVIEVDHPTEGKIKQIGIATKLSDTPGSVRTLAPLFGEQTEEILADLGYSKEKINDLCRKGAIEVSS